MFILPSEPLTNMTFTWTQKNREIIANLIVSSVTGLDTQYLAITPSQLTFTGKDIHLITVQNVEGASLIKEVT